MAAATQPPIRHLAVLGDGRSAALVDVEGRIGWWCPGRFDAPALFCHLLDAGRGGFWQVRVAGGEGGRRRYARGSNVLVGEEAGDGGVLRRTDFQPWAPAGSLPGETAEVGEAAPSRIVRHLEAVEGRPWLEVALRPTPDFARRDATVERDGDGLRFAWPSGAPGNGEDKDRSSADPPEAAGGHGRLEVTVAGADGDPLSPGEALRLEPNGDTWRGHLRLPEGGKATLVLSVAVGASNGDTAACLDLPFDPAAALAGTLAHWRRWAARISYRGPFREAVERSALLLRLLVHQPTGALVAAPTTSLPEVLGGVRNWDYRYTWLRDTSMMLGSLMRLGFHDEAMAFWRWAEELELGENEATGSGLRIVYGVDRHPVPAERELAHLTGYRDSRPVRVGNDAGGQEQLDVCGYLLEAGHTCQVEMGEAHPELAPVLRHCADHLAGSWRRPDRGIWEIRGEPRHFVHSKHYAWIGLDRAIRLAERGWLEGDAGRWRRERRAVARAVSAEGWNPEIGAFTQAFGHRSLDATALLLPTSDLLPADDPRLAATVERVQQSLQRGPYVYRYRGRDGLPGDEGAFLLCSFWMVETLVALGRHDEARARLGRLSAAANDVGLFAEEADPSSGELLGNFPQAFSHLGLIAAALSLGE